jgi:hypothetical protein
VLGFPQSTVGCVAVVVAFPECPENEIKKCSQWQATNDGHKTCGNGMPLDATPHKIK